MIPATDRRTIAKHLAAGRFQDAVALIRDKVPDTSLEASLDVLEAEYQQVQRDHQKGVLSYEERQVRVNRLNDRLLSLVQPPGKATVRRKQRRIFWLAGILIALSAAVGWWIYQSQTKDCPTYPPDISNRVLIVPFENVGGGEARPQVVIRDRINELSAENRLSVRAHLGSSTSIAALDEAPMAAEVCEANVVVWGTYAASDSIRLVLNYYFKDQPAISNTGQLLTLRDAIGLQSGKMLKGLDDAIMSLCGLIALREGDEKLAEKWFEKVEHREPMDREVLRILQEEAKPGTN